MTRRLLPLLLLFSPVAALSVFATSPSETEMAARIDELLDDARRQSGVSSAPLASDSEFLRRAWLDLCGTIPPLNHQDGISGIQDFLGSEQPDKRAVLLRRLLEKPSHAAHLATIWKNVMLPAEANVRRFGGDSGFQNWLRVQFADNVPYDELVRSVLLSTGAANQVGPSLFYTALELKPEELAASTSRIFLGTQIQCAQCHDHPFDHWTRRDFWSYAAFFARLARPGRPQQVAATVSDVETGEVKLPDTGEVVSPRFLGGAVSADDGDLNRRQRLAAWLTSRDNPYFAAATVNRAWALLFGRGIVDPVDDLGKHNAPSHPELLDELSQYFVDSDFDFACLLRTIASTRAYQLSSQSSPGDPDRPELFARMAIKSLTAEQLYDCLGEAMRRREFASTPGGRRFDQARLSFLTKFRAPGQGATQFESGIPQALTLMNGALVREATDLAQSDVLVALNAPFFTDERRVEVLFLSTLSRPPTPAERRKFVQYVAQGKESNDRRAALGDVLWALLNSAEFALNH